MKLLWLCNMIPAAVRAHAFGKEGDGLWTDHVLSGLRDRNVELRILCRGPEARGALDDRCSYAIFGQHPSDRLCQKLQNWMEQELRSFQPDVIHIWGTEYAHTLAMINACETQNLLDRTVISTQGLISRIACHYTEGLPYKTCASYTFRDLVRRDNILDQQKTFARRGALEVQALKKARHIIGRTHWDRACVQIIQPCARYYHCDETLREQFYTDTWSYSACRKHRIFASSYAFPLKGFHYLLEAAALLVPDYPDLTIAVTGDSFLELPGLGAKLRQSSYPRYLARLARKYGLEDRIEFLGALSAQQMKDQYLMANAFALPSTIENSPNSLGEAMLLGVPCAASLVGGVATMLRDGEEGLLYQSTAPYMLADCLGRIFQMEAGAERMGQRGRGHALSTHDPEKNLKDLLSIYRFISSQQGKERI